MAELGALLWFVWCERRGAPLPRRIDERMLAWSAEDEGKSQMLSSVAQDVRFAARILARTPGFTLVATVTIALAIGANTAIFSVVNAVLLRPLPYAEPERLVVLGNHTDGGTGLDSTTPGNFYDWQRGTTAFESMAAFAYTERVFTWNSNADRVLGTLSAGSVFDVLGRQAAVGRTFGAAEDQPGGERIVVLSHKLAERMFGGPSSAVGKAFGLGGESFTVVGVMPPDFRFPDYDAEFWVPARFDQAFRANRDQYFLEVAARLTPGTTLAQARAQLVTVMDAIRREHPQFTENATAGAIPMKGWLVDGVRTRVLTVMGAVALILLIACANLGNLLLARAATRRREMAVRHALGARPLRLARQLLTESLLLSGIGGALGLTLAVAMLKVLLAFMPDDIPRADGIAIDPMVLAFSIAVSLVSGLAFGLFPALQLARRAPLEDVREGSRGSGRTGWVRSGLVTSQVALALVLLAGAGLLLRSFENLGSVPHGFRSDRLLTFSVSVPTTVYKETAQRTAFFDTARARLEGLPGVQSVAMASTLPLDGRGWGAWFNMLDRPVPGDKTPPAVTYRVVGPDYFRALGIPLLRGRELTEHDRLDGPRSVVISESVARKFWPDGDPLGKRIFLGALDNRLFPDAEIVGIVADVRQRGPGDARTEAVFIPRKLMPAWPGFSFALRTSADPLALAPAARAAVRGIDADVPVIRMRTMDEVIARSMASPRSSTLLLTLFAALALTLATIGVFGVLSYSVAQQTTELSIRLALGASARQVALLVLGRGMRPVLAGVACGLAGALATGRFVESLLFGVAPGDPLTFATVAGLLTLVAAVASYVPARAATRVDPALVLRQS